MTTHSTILAWKIPWTEEPCGLQSMGSQSWTLLPAKTLDFSTHQMKNMGTEVGGDRKVAFILSWRRGKYSRVTLKNYSPVP